MNPALIIAVYSVAGVASSLFGGWLPTMFRLTHVGMQVVLSFVGGTMLGVGLLHMLPHSVGETGSLDTSLVWLLVGLIGMFLLIRTFHFHEHGPALVDEAEVADASADPAQTPRTSPDQSPAQGHAGSHSHTNDHSHTHSHDHAHDHAHEHHAHEHHSSQHPLSSVSWLGVACGLSLHAFLDGVALAAGVISDVSHRGQVGFAGFGVFLAIVLHKPLDALSITTLMQSRGSTRRAQQAVNAGFAMMCPAGALLFAYWVQDLGPSQH